MRTKPKTIKLAKIRRLLIKLARRKYEWQFSEGIDNDVKKVALKIYEIMKR